MISCSQCDAMMIMGTFCHETGCPNSQKFWSEEEQDWVGPEKEELEDIELEGQLASYEDDDFFDEDTQENDGDGHVGQWWLIDVNNPKD